LLLTGSSYSAAFLSEKFTTESLVSCWRRPKAVRGAAWPAEKAATRWRTAEAAAAGTAARTRVT
jgi:hypothetical protein